MSLPKYLAEVMDKEALLLRSVSLGTPPTFLAVQASSGCNEVINELCVCLIWFRV